MNVLFPFLTGLFLNVVFPSQHNPCYFFFIILSSHLTHLTHASLVFFCAICMLHVAQSEDDDTDYEMNDSD